MLALLRPLLAFAFFALWVYCIVDVIRAHQESVRYIHKLVWLVLVIVLPTVGGLAWLFLGRPDPIGSRLVPQPAPERQVAPDDSPEFLARLDEEIRRRRRADQIPTGARDPDVDDEIERLEEQFDESDDPEDREET